MILGVFAHPDDELFAGGLLSVRARSNTPVHIVVATRGENGRSSLDPAAPLAPIRETELRASCDALGIEPPTLLGLPDGGLEATEAELRERLAAVIEDRQPDEIVTTGPDGVYGHPDHLAVTRSVSVVSACAILCTAFPRGLFERLRATLSKVAALDIRRALSLGTEPSCVDFALDIDSETARAKRQAIACHRSQLRNDQFLFPGLIEHMCRVEWYTRHEPGDPSLAGPS